MTFAISWEADEIQAGGFLYFDAVTSWDENYSGTATSHPIDSGSNITDHYVSNNPTFRMSAVISSTDISTSVGNIQNSNGDVPYNVEIEPFPVTVVNSGDSLLTRFIPNVIGQFIPDRIPEVQMDVREGDSTEEIRSILTNLQSGRGFNLVSGKFETAIRPITLYETESLNLLGKKLPTGNSFLVITDMQFKEDVDSGYALYVDITFEQVSFTTLERTTLSSDTSQPFKKKAASKESLGKVSSEKKDPNDPANTDAEQKKKAASGADPEKAIVDEIANGN